MGSKKKPTIKKKSETAPRKKRSQGAINRWRGHQFERDLVKKLRKIFPDVRRNLEYQKEVARHGVDLCETGRYLFQCKRTKHNYAPISSILQININPLVGGCPVLVAKADGQEEMAVLPLRELIRLLRIEKRG